MIKNSLKTIREQQMRNVEHPEHWTQEGLGRQVGVSRQTIIAIEKGTYNPSLELAFKLARVFNRTIEDIFTYGGADDEK
jgi:putative transcriptional regulator